MKSLLPLFLVFTSLSVNVLGLGNRGVAERILYYYAYLAEGKLLDAAAIQQPSIAPGCQGASGGRCTFVEFADYIWTPLTNEAKPINVAPEYSKMAGKSFESIDITAMYNMIGTEKGDPDNKERYLLMSGNVDGTKLVSGATSWYQSLAEVAGPIGRLGNTNPTDDVSKNIVTNGRNAAGLVHELRLQNMDKFRPKALAKFMGVSKDDIKTKPGPNEYKVTGDYKIFDPSATVQHLADTKYNGDREQAKQALEDAHTRWLANSDAGREHIQALSSAQSSLSLTSCSHS